MDPATALHHLGGVAELDALRPLEVSASTLRRLVAEGSIVRIRRGCYALPDTDRVTIAETAWRGRATCVTVAERCGLPLLAAHDGVHLAIPAGRNHGRDHLCLPSHVTAHHVADPHQAGTFAGAIDLASRCTAREEQLVIVDAALSRGLLRRGDIAGFTATGGERRAFLLRHASAASGSLLETMTGLILRRARIPFAQQVEIEGLGRVDFVVDGRLIVEVDGRATHDTPEQFVEDRRRDRAAAIRGYRVLRFTYGDVIRRPDTVLADVRSALAAPSRL
ncbi:type IV toxin-antitoxin system AbiEi family antitoxin domain-containing protein [Demequina sp. SYSU T00192]|uniref:Type IV toxin-antitoxin system AbiEi family antitoxin domain-containing protein n=1 Tax=Demequina litoralis TaxID=3051660 RepID=A0ABT8GAC6_9MICO|nr:type IV toxin-antitoxin system AbiEi family antitoxin domain-containing protein [Demequina sp. SYSU T00192]MDN4475927.1 type IV toxin-antitoxin system AbiEi family antitoxin domain-containing protein [Demequina sp. SYSU T00192]